jgi:Spy/CpxP family protein refolding chaperone
MRTILLAMAALAAIALGGCGSSSSGPVTGMQPGTGQIMNPGGKPQTPADAANAQQRQKEGAQMNNDMQKSASAIAAAKQRTGGK